MILPTTLFKYKNLMIINESLRILFVRETFENSKMINRFRNI